MVRSILACTGALMLAGCISTSSSAPVSDLAGDWRTGSHIELVQLERSADLNVSPEFDQLFAARVKAGVDRCATGPRGLRLEARLDKLTKANPLVTAILVGQNKVRGTARLVDMETGQVVGEYRIGRTVTGSRVGVIAMAQAEEQLSDGFAAEVCRQTFRVEGAVGR
jgi:hypothetical protein